MSEPETASRVAVRTLCVGIALSLASLIMAWSPHAGAAPVVTATRESPCGSPGQVYAQKIIVAHKNGRFDLKTLFLVCRPSHVLAIVDSDGGSYKDLGDFRAHNHLFSEDDRITLPRNFPSADTSAKVGFMTVSGHTGTSSIWWWLIGGIVLVLIVCGALLRLRARRRRSGPSVPAEPQEPSPAEQTDTNS